MPCKRVFPSLSDFHAVATMNVANARSDLRVTSVRLRSKNDEGESHEPTPDIQPA